MAQIPSRLPQPPIMEASYDNMETFAGNIRNLIEIFRQQITAGPIPEDHLIGRLVGPFRILAANLESVSPDLTTPRAIAYAKTRSGDDTLDLSIELPALIAELRTAADTIETAMPQFNASRQFSTLQIVDADGQRTSVNTISLTDVAGIQSALDAVLARIV